jgi:hypothetical protein
MRRRVVKLSSAEDLEEYRNYPYEKNTSDSSQPPQILRRVQLVAGS